MKLKLAIVLAVLASLAVVAPANAFVWHLNYVQAKHAAREHARTICNQVRGCESYGVGKCIRRASSRFDCVVGYWFPGEYGPEEDLCTVILHVGVSYAGYVEIKNAGEPHC